MMFDVAATVTNYISLSLRSLTKDFFIIHGTADTKNVLCTLKDHHKSLNISTKHKKTKTI